MEVCLYALINNNNAVYVKFKGDIHTFFACHWLLLVKSVGNIFEEINDLLIYRMK